MLDTVEQTWKSKYPALGQSWRNNWLKVVPMFSFMPELRRLIYTSNPIESVNRGLRKSVKTRTIFPNDEDVFKLMFLTMQRLEEKWTMPIQLWAKCPQPITHPLSRTTTKLFLAFTQNFLHTQAFFLFALHL